MACHLSEEELWSGIDRHKPEVERHLAECSACRERATGFQAGIDALGQAATPDEGPLPDRIGSYTILRRLGHGGMGIVYEGEQRAPKRLVAVKVLRGGPYVDEYSLKLFEREAHTLGRLKHPAIAAIYEGGRTDDGQPFFAMELVHGRPVNEYARAEQLSRRDRLILFRRICDAITYAHQRGVIHRDLKPTNILVDPTGQPKVLDFGLARITDPDAAVTTVTRDVERIMGTLPYMSPEEARGNPDGIDVRSDVYSLGVMLYELLTGKLPYSVTRSALPEAVRVICEEQPRRPGLIDPALRGDLETITLKALEKDTERRYQTAGALADDITRCLTDQPIQARRAGPVYRTRKLIQRHKFACILGAAVAVVLIAAALWVHSAEREFQRNADVNATLQELGEAAWKFDLAQARHELRHYGKAERNYKAALATFERLGRQQRAAEAKLGLGTMMVERGLPIDFIEAEYMLRDAKIFFDREPSIRREERRRILEGLRTLYGPQGWDLPDELREVEQELQEIETIDALGNSTSVKIEPSG